MMTNKISPLAKTLRTKNILMCSQSSSIKIAVTVLPLLILLSGCANLVVNDLAVEPNRPKVGSPVTFSATIKNTSWFSTAGPSHVYFKGRRLLAYEAHTITWESDQIPSIGPNDTHTVSVTPNSTFPAPGRYIFSAHADYQDEVRESNEKDNSLSMRFLVGWSTTIPTSGSCILPIPGNEMSKVSSGEAYHGATETGGINFEFKSEADQNINVVSPCDGSIVYRERSQNDEFLEREVVRVFIQTTSDPRLYMVISFEPDRANAGINQSQDDAITVQVNDTITKGDTLGQLIVQQPESGQQEPSWEEWFPAISWTVFYADQLYPGFQPDFLCPRDFITSEYQADLEQRFNELNNDMDTNWPQYPIVPVCQ